MHRRQFTAASASLLTAGIAGCSQSADESTPTENATSTGSPTPADESMASTSTPAPTGMSMEPAGTQLVYEGDALTLENAPEQEIRGTSDLEAGTTFDITVDSTTASDPFVKRVYPTVANDGTFSTTVDMSNTDEGTEFAVRVNYDGETVAEADGRIA